MTKKNSTHPSQAEMSAHNTRNSKPQLTPRQHRALVALVERGAVPCKELGILAGQNNFAELCAGLRRKLGADAIATGSFDSLDRDGKPCKPGFYELTTQGRERAMAYQIESTPTLVINGKYRLDAASAGGQAQAVELALWLVNKELKAAKK